MLTAPRLRVDTEPDQPLDILLDATYSQALICGMVVEFEHEGIVLRVGSSTNLTLLTEMFYESKRQGSPSKIGADLDYSVDLPDRDDPETERIGRMLLSAFDLSDKDVDRIWEGLPEVEFTDEDKKRLIESVVKTLGLKPPPADV
jgi:hypothetical protein